MALAPISPAAVAGAYQRVQAGPGPGGDAFGGVLARAVQGVVDAGHQAEAQTVRALSGGGNLTDVATAVSQAQLALQAATAVRDRVVQAYQEIMRMPI